MWSLLKNVLSHVELLKRYQQERGSPQLPARNGVTRFFGFYEPSGINHLLRQILTVSLDEKRR